MDHTPSPYQAIDLDSLDPLELQIQQEVEEFLRDLTLEYPFPEIFEILRRHEFRDRYGHNVLPLPQKRFCTITLKEINQRIDYFLDELREMFGERYTPFIEESFRYYTETTIDEH